MEAILEKTTKSDQKIARALKPRVTEACAEIAKTSGDTVSIKIDGYKKLLDIPKSAVVIFFKILDNMAEGNSLAIFLSENNEDMSTQQAADILGVSRPYVVGLLEKGDIPFHKVGSHRRIQLKDLITYNQKLKKNRAGKLDYLADQAQKLNMGY